MYFSLLQDKRVHIVGPFRDVKEFLEWKKEEKIAGSFRAMDCQVSDDGIQCIAIKNTTSSSKEI